MAEMYARENGNVRSVFWSLDEFAEHAEENGPKGPTCGRDSWAGGSLAEVAELARTGWTDKLAEVLDIAEHAVTETVQQHEEFTFAPVFDVAGGDVDVARFLAGEPECMVDYPLTKTSKVGRVITLCASITVSGAYTPEELIRRGMIVTALAFAIERLGHSVELWADHSVTDDDGMRETQRIRVKGANDMVDPARIVFAYAHPGMLRRLAFAIQNGMTGAEKVRFHVNTGRRGFPKRPAEDLPEGTIYMPSSLWMGGDSDPTREVTKKLRELELIED